MNNFYGCIKLFNYACELLGRWGMENLWKSQSEWLLNLWSVWYLCPCVLAFITAYVCASKPSLQNPYTLGKDKSIQLLD